MALRLVETGTAPRLRGPHVDLWFTLSAWIWAAYTFLIAGALLWWAL